MKKILVTVGVRPNFIKVSQLKKKIAEKYSDAFELKIVHTGQHFDGDMSDIFFQQLGITADFHLGISGSSPSKQIAEIIIALEKLLNETYRPDLMIVVGDVNSTFAAAFISNRLGIPLAHIESGLRSFDRSMPEEINRILTDRLSDFLFITEQSGMDNLLKEGKRNDQIYFSGNTMIDALVAFKDQITNSNVLEANHLLPEHYALMTMHRPATVDHEDGLNKIAEVIAEITKYSKLIFPVHPRTSEKIRSFGLERSLLENKNLLLLKPQDYFGFQKLVSSSSFVITDSGGIQEETTYYGIPCLTLRKNTERPSTIELGTNELIPFDIHAISEKLETIRNGKFRKGVVPPLWDGKATDRILETLSKNL